MINEASEIKEFEYEKIALNNKNDVFRNSLADQLVNGVGEDMINYIKNPPVPPKKVLLKIKIKRFFDRIFQTI